jgi:hypothetical protein
LSEEVKVGKNISLSVISVFSVANLGFQVQAVSSI